MKILVLSDSHGNLTNMQKAVEQLQPDCVLHLGDYWSDALKLKERLDSIPIYMVPGNCDRMVRAMEDRLIELEGVRMLMMHGHRFSVKQGPLRAIYSAQEKMADVLCYGHTHIPLCTKHDDLWILNPGTCGGNRPTCGMILAENGTAECSLYEIGGMKYDSGN